MLSQVFFKKLAITLTNFAADFTLERLDDEGVSVRVYESCVSTTPRSIFWLGNKFDSLVFKTSIGFVNVINEQTNFQFCFWLQAKRYSSDVKNRISGPLAYFLKTKNILIEKHRLF